MHPGVSHRVDTDPIARRSQRIQVAGQRGAGDKADENGRCCKGTCPSHDSSPLLETGKKLAFRAFGPPGPKLVERRKQHSCHSLQEFPQSDSIKQLANNEK
jgi:hypothetical protein